MTPIDILKDMTVLYVEDEAFLQQQTAKFLQRFFKEVILAPDGAAGLKIYETRPVDLIITDIQMPELDGLAMTKQIRRRNRDIPIIITSAYGLQGQLLEAVRLNLVDYLLKPLSQARLKNALKASAERMIESQGLCKSLGPGISYDMINHSLTKEGDTVPLSGKEAALLDLLLKYRGQVVSKDRIATSLYNHPSEMSEPALKNLVFKLRKKVGRERIVNVHSLGFKLTQGLEPPDIY